MKIFSSPVQAIMAFILVFPSFAASAASGEAKIASLQISCKELLDIATYAEYFSSDLKLFENDSREFYLVSPREDIKSTVKFTLLYLNTEAFIEVVWSNYYNGTLLESHSDQFSVERNRPYEMELQARKHPSHFRNSCTIVLK